jgi:hypothetical protein
MEQSCAVMWLNIAVYLKGWGGQACKARASA